MSTPPLNDEQIEALLSEPTPGAIATVRALEGDFMVLGVGGKMGTTTPSPLCQMTSLIRTRKMMWMIKEI
jgi:hypothetical protein